MKSGWVISVKDDKNIHYKLKMDNKEKVNTNIEFLKEKFKDSNISVKLTSNMPYAEVDLDKRVIIQIENQDVNILYDANPLLIKKEEKYCTIEVDKSYLDESRKCNLI